MPWALLLAPLRSNYPKGERGRRPIPLDMRNHFMQQWFGLSDPGMEGRVGAWRAYP